MNAYEVIDGILYRSKEKGKSIVITEILIDELLDYLHKMFGHPTNHSFMKLFNEKYYYPHLRDKVNTLVKQCVICSKIHTHPKYKYEKDQERSFMPNQPCESIYVDIIPQLPQTTSKNTALLLIMYQYSRYITAFCMKDKSALSVRSGLMSYFMTHMGTPNTYKVIQTHL